MTDARDHLVLALDVASLDEAPGRAPARSHPWFAIGEGRLRALRRRRAGGASTRSTRTGLAVFVDLKLLDIPTTVERAARVLGRRGVEFLNFHAVGGVDMLRAGVDRPRRGCRDGGHARRRSRSR